jgi:hypothetical protein
MRLGVRTRRSLFVDFSLSYHIAVLAHERLAIVDPIGGAQPLRNAAGSVWLAVNGEIYNSPELRREFEGPTLRNSMLGNRPYSSLVSDLKCGDLSKVDLRPYLNTTLITTHTGAYAWGFVVQSLATAAFLDSLQTRVQSAVDEDDRRVWARVLEGAHNAAGSVSAGQTEWFYWYVGESGRSIPVRYARGRGHLADVFHAYSDGLTCAGVEFTAGLIAGDYIARVNKEQALAMEGAIGKLLGWNDWTPFEGSSRKWMNRMPLGASWYVNPIEMKALMKARGAVLRDDLYPLEMEDDVIDAVRDLASRHAGKGITSAFDNWLREAVCYQGAPVSASWFTHWAIRHRVWEDYDGPREDDVLADIYCAMLCNGWKPFAIGRAANFSSILESPEVRDHCKARHFVLQDSETMRINAKAQRKSQLGAWRKAVKLYSEWYPRAQTRDRAQCVAPESLGLSLAELAAVSVVEITETRSIDPVGGATSSSEAEPSTKRRKNLRATCPKATFLTESDCEPILHMYQAEVDRAAIVSAAASSSSSEQKASFVLDDPATFLNKLNGMFAFVLTDEQTDRVIAARDHAGIIPLYMGRDSDGALWFSSELKAICDICVFFEDFPPGHYYDSRTGSLTKWYNPLWHDETFIPQDKLDLTVVRKGLEAAVKRQLMSDVPFGECVCCTFSDAVRVFSVRFRHPLTCGCVCYLAMSTGVLLSGGLDSSVIAAIASRMCPKGSLHSFSVGLKDSPDLKAARIVANTIHTIHHEIHFTIQEGLNAIRDVIYHLESQAHLPRESQIAIIRTYFYVTNTFCHLFVCDS